MKLEKDKNLQVEIWNTKIAYAKQVKIALDEA
jgi:hypothetical protein